jgi:hypothetical protein
VTIPGLVLHIPEDSWGGIDDDELDEIQCLLWKGYTPPAFVSETPPNWLYPCANGETPRLLEWYSRPSWPAEQQRINAIQARTEAAIADALAAKPGGAVRPRLFWRQGYSQFQCAHCRRWFLAPGEEATIEAEFVATFGDIPKEHRVALCEPCYDKAVAALSDAA